MTSLVQHHIQTIPGAIRQQPDHMLESRHQDIEAEVAQILWDGIIKESTGPRSSPIVIILKPISNLRLYNNFRKLNEVSKFDGYPMPQVDMLIQQLGRQELRYQKTLNKVKSQ